MDFVVVVAASKIVVATAEFAVAAASGIDFDVVVAAVVEGRGTVVKIVG